jgi:hypothetical protein
MRIPTAAIPGGGALVAVAATALPVVAYGRQPDAVNLAAGLVLLLAGAELLALAQTRATGLLLVAASTAWFLPDLAVPGTAAGVFLAGTTLAHVVPWVAAVLVAPQGSLTRRRDVAVVTLSALAVVSAYTGGHQLLLPATGVALLLVCVPWRPAREGRQARAAAAHRVAVLSTTAALAGVPLARSLFGEGRAGWQFAAYAILLSVAALALVRVGPWLRPTAALDVGPDSLTALDDLLVAVTDDPSAHAVVRVGEKWARLDGSPAPAPDGAVEPAVVVARNPVPSGMRETVAQALRLAADNVRGRSAVAHRVRDLAAVRARLVHVEDDERQALVGRLRSGPLASLQLLRGHLTATGASRELVAHVRATEQDLERVAVGLDPLEGFASFVDAVTTLASDLGASVTIASGLHGAEVDPSAARALWYAAAEGLANAAKHAPATPLVLSLDVDPDLEGHPPEPGVVLTVLDRGPGPGAAAASALAGVRDRVAAVGGTVRVVDAEPGTRVEVRVPTTRSHVGRTGVSADVHAVGPSLASATPTSEVLP